MQLATLKEALRRLHTISPFTTPDDLAARVTADLHRWLFDEYLAPRLEKATQGEFPLEEAHALLAAIKGLSAPSRNLIAQVMAQGERPIAVGRDAIHSIFITGDHNVVYQTTIQHYPLLKDYIYGGFSDLIADTTRRFVGRAFLFAELEKFQMQHPCGYVRIVAGAGLGKTALAAEIAHRYRAPAFFANASIGRTRPDQCLNHLSADLIVRFGLEHDHLPHRAGEDSTFLRRILAEAAQKVDGPLWVVVDALDAADDPLRGRNPLLLPDHLPHGVYVVLTHRPGDYPLVTTPHTPITEHAISWNDFAQQADIKAYLRRQAERPEIRRVLAEATPPIPIERFGAVLQEASQGNFEYLDYVIEDIAARGPGSDPLNLDTLPKGLKGYYEQFWANQVWEEDAQEWRHLYRPVIALLGVAKEPVTVDWLAHLVGRPSEEVRDQALKHWRRLLSQEFWKGQRAWRIVHQSFADFLAEHEREYWRETHARIADRYLTIWGGLEAGLPRLQDPAKRDVDDRYALRPLAIHLKEAGRVDKVHDLLRVAWCYQEEEPVYIRPGWRGLLDRVLRCQQVGMRTRLANVWYTVHEQVNDVSGYLRDVTYAWRSTEDDPTTSVGLETRYALITASINSLAKNIPPSLLVALVEKDVWDSAQALAYARQMPDPVQRAVALVGLAHQVQEPLNGEALWEALEAARAIQWLEDQMHMLAWVASNLPEPLQQDVLQEILRIRRRPWAFRHLKVWVDAVVDLASQLSELVKKKALSQALAEVRKFTGSDRWEVLTKLAPHLPEHLRMDVLHEALTVVPAIRDEKYPPLIWSAATQRAKALASLVSSLTEPLKGKVLQEALELAREIEMKRWDSKPLVELALRLATLGDAQRALAIVRTVRHKGDQAQGVVRVAPFLPEPLKGKVLQNSSSF